MLKLSTIKEKPPLMCRQQSVYQHKQLLGLRLLQQFHFLVEQLKLPNLFDEKLNNVKY